MLPPDLVDIVLPDTRLAATAKIIETFQEYTGLQLSSLSGRWAELVFKGREIDPTTPTTLEDYWVLHAIPYVHDSLLDLQRYAQQYPTYQSTTTDAMGFTALYGMSAIAERIYNHYRRYNARVSAVFAGKRGALFRELSPNTYVRAHILYLNIDMNVDKGLTVLCDDVEDLRPEHFADDYCESIILPMSTWRKLYPST